MPEWRSHRRAQSRSICGDSIGNAQGEAQLAKNQDTSQWTHQPIHERNSLERQQAKAARNGRLNQPGVMRNARIATAVIAIVVFGLTCELLHDDARNVTFAFSRPMIKAGWLLTGVWQLKTALKRCAFANAVWTGAVFTRTIFSRFRNRCLRLTSTAGTSIRSAIIHARSSHPTGHTARRTRQQIGNQQNWAEESEHNTECTFVGNQLQ